MPGDSLDLVPLEINPADPEQYQSAEGWKNFDTIQEIIRIKGAEARTVEVKTTAWGPCSQRPLMGQPVAIQWTALDPAAVDLGLMDIDRAKTVESAVKVVNRFAGPPLNVMIGDDAGRIAWTVCGKIPLRPQKSRLATQSQTSTSASTSAAAYAGWEGYIPADELPQVVDPPSGFLAAANNRTVGQAYPYLLGHNFGNSYRAYRIAEALQQMHAVTEDQMRALQLDTTAQFYDFYCKLIVELAVSETSATNAEFVEAYQLAAAWNGKADLESQALVLLMAFREVLLGDVLTPFLTPCSKADEHFSYAWGHIDTPLQAILTAKDPALLPDPEQFATWEALVLASLTKSVRYLKANYKVRHLADLSWGRINKSSIRHPLAMAIPRLVSFLNMPREPQPGSPNSVRVSTPTFGASVRMVVSPSRQEQGSMHMPCGQSGHPLSRHYDDQHPYWSKGSFLPFLSKRVIHTLLLKPELLKPE